MCYQLRLRHPQRDPLIIFVPSVRPLRIDLVQKQLQPIRAVKRFPPMCQLLAAVDQQVAPGKQNRLLLAVPL